MVSEKALSARHKGATGVPADRAARGVLSQVGACLSPGGAAVVSQGREPPDSWATVQGLPPLANDGRPSGATKGKLEFENDPSGHAGRGWTFAQRAVALSWPRPLANGGERCW